MAVRLYIGLDYVFQPSSVANVADPNILKFLPIIPFGTSQIFDPIYLFYCHIITYYSSLFLYFYCIGDNNVHNTHTDYYTGEQDIASADFSLEST